MQKSNNLSALAPGLRLNNPMETTQLKLNETLIKPRFSEVDALAIVHHSRYVPWVEEANFNFVENILGITRRDLFELDMYNPIQSIQCKYKNHVNWEDNVIVSSHMHYSKFAYFEMENVLRCSKDRQKIFANTRVKLLITNKQLELKLMAPEFFVKSIKAAEEKHPNFFTPLEHEK
ncbi:MAG: thioesterase family protein [Gilvibacter sp.]